MDINLEKVETLGYSELLPQRTKKNIFNLIIEPQHHHFINLNLNFIIENLIN